MQLPCPYFCYVCSWILCCAGFLHWCFKSGQLAQIFFPYCFDFGTCFLPGCQKASARVSEGSCRVLWSAGCDRQSLAAGSVAWQPRSRGALSLSADGAVSQPKALQGQGKGFNLCAEGLNSNIHCSSGGKIGFLVIGKGLQSQWRNAQGVLWCGLRMQTMLDGFCANIQRKFVTLDLHRDCRMF